MHLILEEQRLVAGEQTLNVEHKSQRVQSRSGESSGSLGNRHGSMYELYFGRVGSLASDTRYVFNRQLQTLNDGQATWQTVSSTITR